jgi:hypothetical protein
VIGPAATLPTSRPMIRDRLRRLVEDLLPWYDRAAEVRHDERTESIRRRSIAARVEVEHVIAARDQRIREAYRRYARGLER